MAIAGLDSLDGPRLYRSRFLQPNTHFAAFFEIYKIIILSHRSDIKISGNVDELIHQFIIFGDEVR